MKKFKQRLAVTLAVTLLAGMVTVPSFGDEVQKPRWVHEDGVWHFYDSEGNMKRNKEKFIQGKFYAFDENGRMYEDELFVAPKSEQVWEDEKGNPIPNRYAFPDGHLAVNSWVKLNDSNQMYTSKDASENADIFWYYFKGGDEEKQTGGKMARDEERTINKNVYRFYYNGQMYAKEWYGNQPFSRNELPTEETFYYQANGDKAIDKWLPLEDIWYHFDSKGNVDEIWTDDMADIATGSDAKAPYHRVESVEPVGDTDVKATVGETVTMNFKVTLASDSDAKKNTFTKSSHDIWGTQTLLGKFTVKKVEENGSCTVEYTTKSLGTEQVSLFVDGEESEPFIVTTSLDSLEDASVDKKADAVDALIESLIDDESIKGDTTETIDAIKDVIQASTGTDKQELQKKLAANPNYSALENLYVMNNKITVKPVDLTDVQSVLGEKGEISMVGGALNASEEVEMKVAPAEIPSNLKPDNDKKQIVVAFDITMAIDGSDENDLDFPVNITISVPEGFDKTRAITLYHYHGDEEPTSETLSPVNGKVTFTTSRFSSFVFVQNSTDQQTPTPAPTPDNGSSDSDSGSTSLNTASRGEWILGTNGWWYKNTNGTYPANIWSYLEYGKVNDWYRFDKDGYIITGWFTDTDGRIYYLNPVSNGFLGAMQTGWQFIDGYWYYFNTESNGYKGMLLVNTVTPDGYHVNELGQRME